MDLLNKRFHHSINKPTLKLYLIDVILPIPLKQCFTYNVNKDEAHFLQPGMRVAVPFGKSKIYTAIVYGVHQNDPPGYETKPIDQILDETPIITANQLKHWEWMANYYMCTLGEVIRAALPSAFLLESETIITLASRWKLMKVTLPMRNSFFLKLYNISRLYISTMSDLFWIGRMW